MTDLMKHGISEAVHDAAADRLNRLQADASPPTERAFRRWIAADPRHAVAFEQIKRDWQLGKLLGERAIGRNRALPRAPFWMQQKVRAGAAGLGLAIVLGVVTIGLARPGGPFEWSSSAQAAIYETAVGEIRTISLPDGSEVVLDTASRLRTAYTSGDRRVTLEAGRARFKVVVDRLRPFRVVVPGGEVMARHSMFEISLIKAAPMITALQGPVELRAGLGRASEARLLPAGSSTVLGDTTPQKAVSAGPGWVSGMLSVDHGALGEAIAAINRYNDVQLRLADPALAQLLITGGFRVRDPSGFADAIGKSFGLVVRRSGQTILFEKAAGGHRRDREKKM